ncbi:hypothetical protein GGR53DRAFT_502664 [Hypoxylon sp. FL1150]|nr:hypothetical protein GGR53DRAFT_502664 [Hypoxylon sp. FL1150]
MLNLITLGHPDPGDAGGTWSPLPRRIDMAQVGAAADVRSISTWGWILLEDPGTKLDAGIGEFIARQDPALRNLVARCMADNPVHRPNLWQLAAIIDAGMRAADERGQNPINEGRRINTLNTPRYEPDRVVDKFYDDYFRVPRIAPDPYAAFWEGGTPAPAPGGAAARAAPVEGGPAPVGPVSAVPAAGDPAAPGGASQLSLMPGGWPTGTPLNMQVARAMDLSDMDFFGAAQPLLPLYGPR